MIGKFVVNLPLVFAIAAGAATAADWEVLDAEPDEAMLLDKNSIQHDGPVWKAWAVQSYKRTEYLGRAGVSAPVACHALRDRLQERATRLCSLELPIGRAGWRNDRVGRHGERRDVFRAGR